MEKSEASSDKKISTIKDVNGKSLRREHYLLLRDLGIEIVMYDFKTFNGANAAQFGFELNGCLTDSVDFDELYELLKLLKIATESSNPAIKEALDRLKIVIGITDE